MRHILLVTILTGAICIALPFAATGQIPLPPIQETAEQVLEQLPVELPPLPVPPIPTEIAAPDPVESIIESVINPPPPAPSPPAPPPPAPPPAPPAPAPRPQTPPAPPPVVAPAPQSTSTPSPTESVPRGVSGPPGISEVVTPSTSPSEPEPEIAAAPTPYNECIVIGGQTELERRNKISWAFVALLLLILANVLIYLLSEKRKYLIEDLSKKEIMSKIKETKVKLEEISTK